MSGGMVELIGALRDLADRRLLDRITPACYGTVLNVVEAGGVVSDVTLRIDLMNVELSWARGEFVIPDNLVLKANDRVVVLPLGMDANLDFVVVARLSADPGRGIVGNPATAVRVARAGDGVTVQPHRHSVRVVGQTAPGGADNHTHAVDIIVDSADANVVAAIATELAARLVVSA